MIAYISKEDAQNAVCLRCAINRPANRCPGHCSLAKDIAAAPPADVKPVVRGEWECIDKPCTISNPNCSYECRVCGETLPYRKNFCPNCGGI